MSDDKKLSENVAYTVVGDIKVSSAIWRTAIGGILFDTYETFVFKLIKNDLGHVIDQKRIDAFQDDSKEAVLDFHLNYVKKLFEENDQ